MAYYARTVLRAILRQTQTIVYRLKKQGYLSDMADKKMLPHNKAQIQQKLTVMRSAHTVELAGCAPSGMHVTGAVANQCYLQGGQCHSGMDYTYYLLFRCTLQGREVVYVHPEPILRESAVAQLLAHKV